MSNIAIPTTGPIFETSLFKITILVAAIVIAMFLSTVLVALIFMPNQVILNMFTQDIRFLLPLTLSAMCSGIVLAGYARSQLPRQSQIHQQQALEAV